MLITPIPHGLGDYIGKSGERTPGLHMSTLFNSFYEDFDPGKYRHDDEPDNLHLLFEFGLAFEQCMERALQARYVASSDDTLIYERPDEQIHEEDGLPPILYNPDLFIMEKGVFRIGEIKLTWMSNKDVPKAPGEFFPDKFAKYETQLKMYCRCLQCYFGRLIICFVNRDWKKHSKTNLMGPELMCFDYTFTRQELDEEWDMVIGHAREKGLIP